MKPQKKKSEKASRPPSEDSFDEKTTLTLLRVHDFIDLEATIAQFHHTSGRRPTAIVIPKGYVNGIPLVFGDVPRMTCR